MDREGYDTNTIINTKTNAVTLQKDGFELDLLPTKSENFLENGVSLKTGKKSFDIVTQNIDGGVPRQAVLIYDKNAPKSYDFEMNLPADFTLEKDEIGGVKILDEKGDLFVAILPPWAKDKNDAEIKTWYEIDGNILRQFVEFNETHQFPIVADPVMCSDMISSVTWHLNRGGKHPHSLAVRTTSCGRFWLTGPHAWMYYNEAGRQVMNKIPLFGGPWSPQSGTYEERSLYDQFVCHARAAFWKDPWNLEYTRPRVSQIAILSPTVACNPE